MRTMLARSISFLGFSTLAALSLAQIDYSVSVADDLKSVRVTMELQAKPGQTDFVFPDFAPGHYRLLQLSGNVSAEKATSAEGLELGFQKVDTFTWRVQTPNGGKVRFAYTFPVNSNNGGALLEGPRYLMYVAGRKEEPHRIQYTGPKGCQFANSLDPWAGKKDAYQAPDYDVFADAPVTFGDIEWASYTAMGKPHKIVMWGAERKSVDKQRIVEICKRLTETQGRLFGGLPYKRYYWHFNCTASRDGGGGLEHLNSTAITLAAGLGPNTEGLLSHEFFHLWNVKRIRSKPLGPFDYQRLPETGALWWLEGVTDYYAGVLCARAGIWDEEQYFRDLLNNVRSARNNARRFETSPYEASMRVKEAANGRGNSQGLNISYYTFGLLLGLVLDAELRERTEGKHSLDDVLLALWELNKDNKPGFEEDEIRKQLIRFGGEEMGPFYDTWVMKPGELPIEASLAKLGYKMAERQVKFVDHGIRYAVRPGNADVGITGASGAADAVLDGGDIVLEVDGRKVLGQSTFDSYRRMDEALAKARVGQPLKLKIKRGENVQEVSFTPTDGTRTEPYVEAIDFGNRRVLRARKGWLSK
jgi:predicted metalloprotease with PDZ domain